MQQGFGIFTGRLNQNDVGLCIYDLIEDRVRPVIPANNRNSARGKETLQAGAGRRRVSDDKYTSHAATAPLTVGGVPSWTVTRRTCA